MQSTIMGLAALIAAVAFPAAAAAQTTIGNDNTGGSIFNGGARSVGQSLISPGGTLTSFSFRPNNTTDQSAFFVFASFDGTSIGPVLYQSAVFSAKNTLQTLNDLNVPTTLGQQYLALIRPTGSNYRYYFNPGNSSYVPGELYYTSSPKLASGTFTNYGRDLAFSATFAANGPEPATWAMMILGFGVAGVALRRRQRGGQQVAMFATA